MALPAKLNNYEKLIRDLFNKYQIPISRAEFKEFILQGEKLSFGSMGNLAAVERGFESQIQQLAQKIAEETEEAENREKAQERAILIAAQRSIAPVRLNNSRLLMSLPFFSPDRRLRKESFEYSSPDGSITLRVIPSSEFGAAKIWDGDVLMYALSKAVTAYLETKSLPKKVTFTAYEYLKQAGKSVSGKSVADLREKLDRLIFTQYKCSLINPATGKEKGGTKFSLCNAEWVNDSEGRLSGITIKFSDELFEYFASKNDLLSLKKGLLLDAWKEDRSGLRKRLLLLVGTHLGEQQFWRVGLKTLQGMCGHIGPLKKFKEAFSELIPSLPWKILFETNAKKEQIVRFESDDHNRHE